ncbi:hypothetical protein M427DRAFT_57494, partial [Gonapodya prolifera JEL478]
MLQPDVLPKPSSLYRTSAIADFILPSHPHVRLPHHVRRQCKVRGRQTKPGVNTCM